MRAICEMIKHETIAEAQIMYIGDRLWEIAKSLITDYNVEPISQILNRPKMIDDSRSGAEILNDIKKKIEERRRPREQHFV